MAEADSEELSEPVERELEREPELELERAKSLSTLLSDDFPEEDSERLDPDSELSEGRSPLRTLCLKRLSNPVLWARTEIM